MRLKNQTDKKREKGIREEERDGGIRGEESFLKKKKRAEKRKNKIDEK